VDVDQATRNALYTVEVAGKNVPVYKGAAQPLIRPIIHADWFHGKDGLGDQGYPPPKHAPQPQHAVDALIETIRANPGIVLVTLGPLTNIALAVGKAPEIVQNVSRCVVMGGAACTVGNVTPAAEFNIWVDPEAARMVFHSGLPIEMIGWELCRGDANIRENEIAMIKAFNTPLAHFAVDCNSVAIQANYRQSREVGISLPDPVAMSVALEPGVVKRRSKHYVEIEVSSELTRGMTVVDQLGVANDERNRVLWQSLVSREPNAAVCWEIDIPRWKDMLYSVLR
jgi:inosine-uridine nucleoside N-ribohydrolase